MPMTKTFSLQGLQLPHQAEFLVSKLMQSPPLQWYDRHITVQRLDLLHPKINGNKPFKLLGHLEKLYAGGYEGWISFGGAWSNHLDAFSAISNKLGIASIAFVRGDEAVPPSALISELRERGTQVKFLDRQAYRHKANLGWLDKLQSEYPKYLIVPEGGGDAAGQQFCDCILDAWETGQRSIPQYLCLAVGTGTTAVGLAKAVKKRGYSCQIIAVPILKYPGFEQEVRQLAGDAADYIIWLAGYEQGGYAKVPQAYIEQVTALKKAGLPLDPIYNGKAFIAALDFAKSIGKQQLGFLHTGGQQGWRGFNRG